MWQSTPSQFNFVDPYKSLYIIIVILRLNITDTRYCVFNINSKVTDCRQSSRFAIPHKYHNLDNVFQYNPNKFHD